MVDALSVLEAAGFLGEGRQEVLGVAGFRSRVGNAEGTTRIGNHGAALATGGSAMLASLGSEVGTGRFLCHFDPRFWKLEAGSWRLDTPHTRVFWEKSA